MSELAFDVDKGNEDVGDALGNEDTVVVVVVVDVIVARTLVVVMDFLFAVSMLMQTHEYNQSL